MDQWKTTLISNHSEGTLYSRQISINSGIFQGDSLSPLLFCMALAPLSSLLNNTSYGYTTSTSTINRLFYDMDDLKTIGKNDQEQTSLLTIVKGFSDDIQMEFSLEKCSKATFKKGNWKHSNWPWYYHSTTRTRRYTEIPRSEWRGWDIARQNERKD